MYWGGDDDSRVAVWSHIEKEIRSMKPTPIVPDLCLSCRRYVQTRRCSRCGEVFPVCHEGYAVKHFSETIALCGECLQCALVRWWEAEGRPSLKSEEL